MYSLGNIQELTFFQLQQQTQQLIQQQNAYLAAQLQLTRSQSVGHNQQSFSNNITAAATPTITKQLAQRSLSDVPSYYHNQRTSELSTTRSPPPGLSTPTIAQKPEFLAQLPQPPCIPIQRRDSVLSEGSVQNGGESTTRYKTEMCRPFEETGQCRYGSKCQFAHGINELRGLNRHPRYKTEFCRTFHTTGFCSYGQRCNFIHNEDERRPSQTNTMNNARPQALQINKHMPLTVTSSNGCSPASSIYGGDASPHSPNYLSDDPFTPCTGSRLSPAPSISSFSSDFSSKSFPSPPGTPLHSEVFSSYLDLSSILSKLNL